MGILRMTIFINESTLKDRFVECVIINSVDNRGFYIVGGGINGGIHYLYTDGHIRVGVNGNGHAFWKTEKEAFEFWSHWKDTQQ